MNKWVLLVENYDSSKPPWSMGQAHDPLEVVYAIALIDDKGNILKKDGYIVNADHGICSRLKEALNNGLYESRELTPAKKAKYKAVKS